MKLWKRKEIIELGWYICLEINTSPSGKIEPHCVCGTSMIQLTEDGFALEKNTPNKYEDNPESAIVQRFLGPVFHTHLPIANEYFNSIIENESRN